MSEHGPRRTPAARSISGTVGVLPGLVNAHTHLELSWLRDQVPPASQFTDWVEDAHRDRGRPDAGCGRTIRRRRSIAAIAEARASGTVAVGDISNTLARSARCATQRLGGVVFHELLGFNERRPARWSTTARATRDAAAARPASRVSLAPHAPYSVSPRAVRARFAPRSTATVPIMSVHLGESAEEVEFLATGSGPWRAMLEELGAWTRRLAPPGCGRSSTSTLGVLDADLVVHGVQFSDAASRAWRRAARRS